MMCDTEYNWQKNIKTPLVFAKMVAVCHFPGVKKLTPLVLPSGFPQVFFQCIQRYPCSVIPLFTKLFPGTISTGPKSEIFLVAPTVGELPSTV